MGVTHPMVWFTITTNARRKILASIEPVFQKLQEIIESVFLDAGTLGAYEYVERLIKNPEKKQEIIATAFDEIMQKPTNWRCLVFLNGLVSKNRHSITGVTIRPPTAADFKTYRVPLVPHTRPNIPTEVRETKVIAVSSVLEFQAVDIPRGYNFKFFLCY